MNISFHLLQIHLPVQEFKFPLLCFLTAFAVTLLTIPPLISLINRYHLYDIPNARKEHQLPVPTMGGLAIATGFAVALLIWLPLQNEPALLSFFFSVSALLVIGVMDDLKDLSANYKFLIQFCVAALIAISGLRITSFNGLFGIYSLSVFSQYFFTILAIVGITNAYNLIDGIDGLAGGLAFMSLATLGLFLKLCGDNNTALVAFALAGGVMAFLYFNFNPARIFMGDTGSLVLGFVIAVLCVRLLQINTFAVKPFLTNTPIFVLGIVLVPVFDTMRVFTLRTWRGGSPFQADRTHIHHLLTNNGASHVLAVRVICFVHAVVLLEVYVLRNMRQEYVLLILLGFMAVVAYVLRKSKLFLQLPAVNNNKVPDSVNEISPED